MGFQPAGKRCSGLERTLALPVPGEKAAATAQLAIDLGVSAAQGGGCSRVGEKGAERALGAGVDLARGLGDGTPGVGHMEPRLAEFLHGREGLLEGPLSLRGALDLGGEIPSPIDLELLAIFFGCTTWTFLAALRTVSFIAMVLTISIASLAIPCLLQF
jgi:hypothetical protein